MTSLGRTTKVDQVYEYLLQEMVNLNYRAGDRIIINQIAKACGVSEIPVREALRRLESDGYVRIVPNQGAVALGLDKEMLIDMVQVKGVLEGFATRLSVDYLSRNDLAQLRQINLKLQEAAKEGDHKAFSELNQKFHMTIYAPIPRKGLTTMISDLWDKYQVTKRIFSVAPNMMEQSYHEHERILELIEQREYNEVERYVREHKFKAMASWALSDAASVL